MKTIAHLMKLTLPAALLATLSLTGCPNTNSSAPPAANNEQIQVFTNQVAELNKQIGTLNAQITTLTQDLNKSKQDLMTCNQELAASKDALKTAQDAAAAASAKEPTQGQSSRAKPSNGLPTTKTNPNAPLGTKENPVQAPANPAARF